MTFYDFVFWYIPYFVGWYTIGWWLGSLIGRAIYGPPGWAASRRR